MSESSEQRINNLVESQAPYRKDCLKLIDEAVQEGGLIIRKKRKKKPAIP